MLQTECGVARSFSTSIYRVCSFVLSLLVPISAQALDPNVKISQYPRTAWLTQDGYLSGGVWGITQTTDGYLWIGTQSGLFRFDGSRFLPWTFPDGEHLPSTEIHALLGAHDGSLRIGTREGLAHLIDQKLINFPSLQGNVDAILEDPSGTIWFALESAGAQRKGPICKASGTAVRCLDASDGIVPTQCCAGPLARDRSGNLWVGTDKALIRWRPGSSATYPLEKAATDGLDGVTAIVPSPNGSLWVGSPTSGKGGGLQQFDVEGAWKPYISPALDGKTLNTSALFQDRDGGIWIGTTNRGIYRVYHGQVDRFGAEDGLPGSFVLRFFEDSEGNIWVTTNRGLECFHQLPITSYSEREGLSNDNVVSVLASRDGTVWMSNGNSLDSIKNGRIASISSANGLPGHETTSLFEDHGGRLWVGVDTGLFTYDHGRFHEIHRKDGSSTGLIVGITEDTQHHIWAEVSGSHRELIQIQDRRVVDAYPQSIIPSARPLAADAHGGIWLGLRDGNLARFQDGRAHVYTFPHRTDSDVRQVLVNSDDSVFGTTAFGLVAWSQAKTQVLTTRNGLPCDGMIGVAWDNQGALWLYTECGIVKIEKADLQRWWVDSNTVIAPTIFGAFEGFQTGVPDFNPTAKSSDRRLWFANQFGLQMIDPSHLVHNELPPPVHVENIVADRKNYHPIEGLRLPPLLRDLEIDYTALSFANPRAVRFRYRLEGRDHGWQETTTRRQAFYTDLRPGGYRFRVIACNNDGVWNEQGAALNFRVLPAWYQTLWFQVVALSLAAGLAYLLISFDRRRYDSLVRIRFDERLEERTRIARDLHDTLLQTIQGSKLVADHARVSVFDPDKTRNLLNQLSDWLGRASLEGRTALESLHATKAGDLTEALRAIVEDFRTNCDIEFSLSHSGPTGDMIPLVRDEVYWIGYEAIRNAIRHSGARHIDIHLVSNHELELRIIDDGQGIAEDTLSHGKAGHFGLKGMRERATKIGAALTISNSPTEGTVVRLIVPTSLIFAGSNRARLRYAQRWLRSTHFWNRR
jgi:signal transduction histidine kinase/ligand-binding sensor domain-containing protein